MDLNRKSEQKIDVEGGLVRVSIVCLPRLTFVKSGSRLSWHGRSLTNQRSDQGDSTSDNVEGGLVSIPCTLGLTFLKKVTPDFLGMADLSSGDQPATNPERPLKGDRDQREPNFNFKNSTLGVGWNRVHQPTPSSA